MHSSQVVEIIQCVPKTQSPPTSMVNGRKIGCGGRIRTYDLQVMSLTSYRAAPPRAKSKRICLSNIHSYMVPKPDHFK